MHPAEGRNCERSPAESIEDRCTEMNLFPVMIDISIFPICSEPTPAV